MHPLAEQWRVEVIQPVLTRLDLLSDSAVNLLLGTIAVESQFKWIRQWPHGPARGFYQIELPTAHDVLNRCPDKYFTKVMELGGPSVVEDLVWNLAFQTAIARLKYYLIPQALPPADNILALAEYWLTWYNGGGKGTIMRFLDAWNEYVNA